MAQRTFAKNIHHHHHGRRLPSLSSSSTHHHNPNKNLKPTSNREAQQQEEQPKLIITGPTELSGHISISGSKNSSLSILAATLCCKAGSCKLNNVPTSLLDIKAMGSVLASLDAEVESSCSGNGEMVVSTHGLSSVEPDASEVGKIRGGFLVIGPLLGRFGEAVVGLPGGCDIGARPIDLHLRGLEALGAIVELRDGKVFASAANGKGLVGGKFFLDYPSVGATQTLLMAACMAEGTTVLSNVAREPEVVDLVRFLRNCGACIEGAGTGMLYITGKSHLHGCEYDVMPDRIEAGTFMLATAITRSRISVSPVFPSDLVHFMDKLAGCGCRIRRCSFDTLEISAGRMGSSGDLRGFDIKTCSFPGFPTDLQPQTMALLTTCDGVSTVDESVFENRMGHARELQKFGSRIQVCGSTALVFGKEKGRRLCSARVTASDLRGGMSLVLAGLAADGVTEISGVSHIDRGYEDLEMKLQLLGSDIKRVSPAEVHCRNLVNS